MHSAPRQPLLDAAVVALRAPTQVWSDETGHFGASAIHGVYHGDVRHIRAARITLSGSDLESVSHAAPRADTVVFGALARGLDGDQADPFVRMSEERIVGAGTVTTTVTIASHRSEPVRTRLSVHLTPDFTPMQSVKAGITTDTAWAWDGQSATSGTASFLIEADSPIVIEGPDLVLAWDLAIEPRSSVSVTWRLALSDSSLVVAAAPDEALDASALATGPDPRVRRWLDRASADLAALRLTLPAHPDEPFYAAGAPWFFTLFGRDSLWAARLALPLDPAIALSTLHVLARLQGTKTDPATAEAPGKIPHELRSAPLTIPNEDVHLPPLYYGTVDATALWVCLFADLVDQGLPLDEQRRLLRALQASLGWLVEHGAASGNGFIDYVDESGRGLANQGWKDSGDSIQWRDGTLATGPIALCEVQAYAYEAATRGAAILDGLGEPGGGGLRTWAAGLRARFRSRFWVTTPEGRYPAIALDRHGRGVDTLTSNIGHLIGTGLLDPDEEESCTALLTSPALSSGFGVRTLSTDAAGYWPLSYHGGSVWIHDSAIAVHGLLRAGRVDAARSISAQLLDAAEGFDYRVPELHSGDDRTEVPRPAPYPAACRPQAWSAAAAVVVADALGR